MLEFHDSEFPMAQMPMGIDGDAQKDSLGFSSL
jgi:hypothetical protein